MTPRERFLATARFEPVDRAFLLQPWLWRETLERWQAEGLPEDTDLAEHFGTDRELCVPLAMQGPYGPHLYPPLERRVLEQTDRHVVVRDEEGNTVRLLRDDPLRSMPEWIEYPVRDRDDWEHVAKPRLNASIPGRRAEGEAWARYVAEVRERDYPLGLWCGSFYGWPRSLMGVERLSVTFYDDPRLVHEMCEHIADFVVALIEPILRDIELDFAFVWEDMGAKSGPLCSPDTYRRFMVGPLRRVTDLLHSYGIDIIIVDSDGNNDALIPLWLEAGVTGLRPFEIAANCDPVAARKQYGRSLVIQGGIDKRALAGDRQQVEREVCSKVPWLCEQGGYFPQVDHLVPPDVPLENYAYYAQRVREAAVGASRPEGGPHDRAG
jgi:uroporphyrinogen decarboxylase